MKNIEKLVRRAQGGNDKAFLQLFQQYENDLYRMAYVYTKNVQDALDVVQETAYRSYKSIHTLKEAQYLKTWLIRIVIRCSIDLLRKRNKTLYLKPEATEQIPADEGYDLPLRISLTSLINEMEQDEKEVVLLRFYHDFTIKEVAEILEIPLGSAKTILYRALRKLRQNVEEENLYER